MPIYKNEASQTVYVYAWDDTTSSGTDPSKTGDAANITAQISLDGGASAATNDVNPTELEATDQKGVYGFDLTQAETNADVIVISAVSATSNILLAPVTIYTQIRQTGDSFARLGAPAGASVSADIATVDGNVDELLTRITSTLFTGITSLAEWLGLMAGKQTPDATALAEIKATGAGSGTFSAMDDSLEAHTAYLVSIDSRAEDLQDNLGADWADGGRLDMILDSRMAEASINTTAGAVDNVTLVGTTTTNTDMRGTDSALKDKTGFSLVATGLDLVLVDGKTLPAALEYIGASTAGILSGAGTGTETVKGLDGVTTRLTVTADGSGNRSAVVYG